MIDAHFPLLSRALSESLLWRTTGVAAGIAASHWNTSRTRQTLIVLAGLGTLRVLAVIVLIAGVAALAAQFAMPVYVRSALPIAWPIVALSAIAAIAIMPDAFERAWPESTLHSLSRRSLGEGGSRRSLGEGGSRPGGDAPER